MAFPNHAAVDLEYLNMEGLARPRVEAWSRALIGFVRTITFRYGKRVILKSPTHTGRVRLLSEMFPGAQFIHITRHPYSLFPSTRRLWQSLDAVQGCQLPRDEHLDEYVFESFRRMYDGLESQRGELGSSQIIDIRYEDLVADPIAVVRRVYDQLQLGDFEPVADRFQAYVDSLRDYEPNRHQLEPALRTQIDRQWQAYFEHYGYERET